jgi:hypothetical protein
MEGLGYSRNREPMLALAQGMPLRLLRRAAPASEPGERRLQLQALLLGAASLLSCCDQYWEALGMEPVVEKGAWQLHRIRPLNHPARRLMGMACLLERFWEEGLLGGLTRAVRAGGPRPLHVRAIQEALTVAGPGPSEGAALIGAARAGEIAVNVLLPFCFALGQRTRDQPLTQAAREAFRLWPLLPGNELAREAMHLFLEGREGDGKGLALSARRQQGLIQLYRRALASASGGDPR